MPRETLCRYGNCDKPGKGVSINLRNDIKGLGERPTFCSAEHAALWLLKHALRIDGAGDAATKVRLMTAADLALEIPREYR